MSQKSMWGTQMMNIPEQDFITPARYSSGLAILFVKDGRVPLQLLDLLHPDIVFQVQPCYL